MKQYYMFILSISMKFLFYQQLLSEFIIYLSELADYISLFHPPTFMDSFSNSTLDFYFLKSFQKFLNILGYNIT